MKAKSRLRIKIMDRDQFRKMLASLANGRIAAILKAEEQICDCPKCVAKRGGSLEH